jgi:uncharacterized protein YeeX (DUF496 family)
MKDTIRTASVIEIYNASKRELEKKRKEISYKLSKLKASSTRKIIGVGMIYWFLGLFVGGVFVRLVDANEGVAAVFSLISFGLGLWGMKAYSKSSKSKKTIMEIAQLTNQLHDIESRIQENEVRVQSLLNAEEVIIAKDLKISSQNVETVTFSQETITTELEKVCPMCAETVKKAAKICRYCGYKFE